MKRKPTTTRWTLGLALALVLAALVLAGCGSSGGGSSSGGSTTTASTTGSDAPAAGGMADISAEAKACLKEKGVELPSFKAGKGGEPPEGFEPPAGGRLPEGGEMPKGGESAGGTPPAGAGGPGGEGFEEMKKAFEECGVETPEFQAPAGKGGAPTNSAVFKKQVKEYAACVRKNGYELAEPNLSGEGPVFKKSESESAAFKRASAKCQSLLGGPRGGSGAEGENET